MSLEGAWVFGIEHGGDVYNCIVDHERVKIEAPSGLVVRAKWETGKLVELFGSDGDIEDEELPEDVIAEAELRMGAIEAVWSRWEVACDTRR